MGDQAIIPKARVEASLLDRLSSSGPGDYLSGGPTGEGAKGQRNATITDFEDCVKRDLEWLFNTTPAVGSMSREEIKRFPHVSKSILNYGLRGLFGRPVEDLALIENSISDGLAAFEPRMKVESQRLEVTKEGQIVEIIIEGTLLAKRASRRMVVRTDLETISSKLKTDG